MEISKFTSSRRAFSKMALAGANLFRTVAGGAVVEEGSHDELLAKGGLYAELFALQAEGYR